VKMFRRPAIMFPNSNNGCLSKSCNKTSTATIVKNVKRRCITLCGKTSQSYGAPPAIWDHTDHTCHPTQVNAPHSQQPDRLVLDSCTPKGWKAELTLVLAIYRYDLPFRRQSPIHASRYLIAT